MKLKTASAMFRGGKPRLFLKIKSMLKPLVRISFLSAAASEGLLRALAAGPVDFAELATQFVPDPRRHEAFRAWLQLGVHLGELKATENRYALRGFCARHLAEPVNDPFAALVEEIATLYTRLAGQTLTRLRSGKTWTLADQDGAVIARSSRTLEPLVFEAIEATLPRKGQIDLLEVGCGSGVYIRRAAELNPQLRAVGFELQPEVATLARANLEQWALAERAEVLTGDIRQVSLPNRFDVATLHNNIYYFPIDERVALLRQLRALLSPGGTLLLTTGCQGGSLIMEMLNLWCTTTEGCGPLPGVDEMTAQLGEAGFGSVRAQSLLPGESYYAFYALNPTSEDDASLL